MDKEKFHYMNATIYSNFNYKVLFSYATPVAIVDLRDGVIFITKRKYSSSTTRQINRFVKEHRKNEDTLAIRYEINADDFKDKYTHLREMYELPRHTGRL